MGLEPVYAWPWLERGVKNGRIAPSDGQQVLSVERKEAMVRKKKGRILIIEDDDLMVELMYAVLTDLGYQVASAHKVEVALIDFEQLRYDLVITDLFMEGMGGVEGIAKIGSLNKDIPIIAISAGYKNMPAEKALLAARKIGATAALPKPFTPEELSRKVTEVLGGKVAGSKIRSWRPQDHSR